jgi:chemotaxis protein methyltransferase CheR
MTYHPAWPGVQDADEEGWADFQACVLQLTGVDFRAYKERQMRRRLGSLMGRLGVDGWVSFARLLRQDPAAVTALQNFFTINVSEFFRQPEKFEALDRHYLPELLRHRRALRIWSAGCANGAEPYSIAMLLARRTPGTRHTILATDIDARILDVARAADSYLEMDLRAVPPPLRTQHLKEVCGRFRLTDRIRSAVEFRHHDLLTGPVGGDFDLVVCRNVAIYFTEDAKRRVYQALVAALREGGILFIGATEVVLNPAEYGLRLRSPSFYEKVRSGPGDTA